MLKPYLTIHLKFYDFSFWNYSPFLLVKGITADRLFFLFCKQK